MLLCWLFRLYPGVERSIWPASCHGQLPDTLRKGGKVSHCVPGFTVVRSCCYSGKWVWSSRTTLVAWLQESKMSVGGWWGGKVGKVGKAGEWWCGNVGGSWFYSRVGKTVWVQDFIFLFLMLKKRRRGWSDVNQGKEEDELKIFLLTRRDEKTLLRSSTSC